MHEYILKEVCRYTRKQNEFDKYLNKKFKMMDKISIGSMVELDFGQDKIKVKLNEIYKTDDKEKLFCISTSKFVAIVQAIPQINN